MEENKGALRRAMGGTKTNKSHMHAELSSLNRAENQLRRKANGQKRSRTQWMSSETSVKIWTWSRVMITVCSA